ncbi:hypothetical protein E4T56_gene9110 [Termitomyces sp. T112]|nr:hypothetical protein E4T56_gene9110 [Termitomyces sp. T112]
MLSSSSLAPGLILLTGPLVRSFERPIRKNINTIKFIGILFNWALLGVLLVQVYIYFTNKYNDSTWIRAYVAVFATLDMLQTGFSTQFVWEMLILDWGDFAALGRIPWTSITLPIMSGIIGAFVQIFFAWRIHILKQDCIGKWIAIFIILTSLVQSISALAFAIQWAIVGPEKGVHLVAGCTVGLVGGICGMRCDNYSHDDQNCSSPIHATSK